MKSKIFIISLCATFLFVFAACKNSPKADADEQKTEAVVEEVVEEAEKPIEIPTFKDEKVQKFVNDYAAFVDEYIEAYTANDAQKIKKVTEKAKKLATQQKNYVEPTLIKTSAVQYQKFVEFMGKMADKVNKAPQAK
ncbi:MAG: hypothetical protein LBS52_03540 [Dysgonamonadaceae bacterium]|jgi:hypothetical protein|nr:hypothetical protein [Dysgonamonadaceae bacterium]